MMNAAHPYAQALYTLAQEEDRCRSVLDQMGMLNDVFEKEPEFLRLLASAKLSKQERCQILDETFRGKIHPYLLNFLKVLSSEGVILYFSDCVRFFARCYYADNHILQVLAYTAQSLTEQQLRRLEEKIRLITGKTVILENRIDADCLGGVRLCYDGKQVDGTVKKQLETVGSMLKNTLL